MVVTRRGCSTGTAVCCSSGAWMAPGTCWGGSGTAFSLRGLPRRGGRSSIAMSSATSFDAALHRDRVRAPGFCASGAAPRADRGRRLWRDLSRLRANFFEIYAERLQHFRLQGNDVVAMFAGRAEDDAAAVEGHKKAVSQIHLGCSLMPPSGIVGPPAQLPRTRRAGGEKQTPELADLVARAGAPEGAELGDGGAGLVDAAEHLSQALGAVTLCYRGGALR